MYEIEKGIPVPAGRGVYPFATMAVGDCFTVPNGSVARSTAVRSAAGVWARKNPGQKFIVRTVEGGTVTRCWRVA